jgi:hypothetical protein
MCVIAEGSLGSCRRIELFDRFRVVDSDSHMSPLPWRVRGVRSQLPRRIAMPHPQPVLAHTKPRKPGARYPVRHDGVAIMQRGLIEGTVDDDPDLQQVQVLEQRLRAAWCKETSSEPDSWSSVNPSSGQCAVTALVLQDHVGGELLRGDVDGVSHYWNRLPNGREIDLTRAQFGRAVVKRLGETRSRQHVLSFPSTVVRYHLLEARLGM